MEHFVILINSHFLPQGLALHASMERHIGSYTLWIVCVDDATHEVLAKLGLPNVNLLRVVGCETEALLKVRAERSIGEYCWTIKPFAPKYVFEADAKVHRVTYLDADIWFLNNPQQIFNEFDASDKQVLITEHAYANGHDQSEKSGFYCAQLIIFNRLGGENVRQWWEDRCIEWCYARAEGGKFGDQKYLEEWPKLFGPDVHVLSCVEATQAPWNIARFENISAILYHFHGLRILDNNLVHIGRYRIPVKTLDTIYTPYLKDLRNAVLKLNEVCHMPPWQVGNKSKVLAYRLAQLTSDASYPASSMPW